MGLASVLVDRARVIRQQRTKKVEGQPILEPEYGPWFRCRVEPATDSARADDGHWTRVASTWLICQTKDLNGKPLQILATDHLQIKSDDIDTGEDAVWIVDGDVTPMRRRKGVIGFEFRIKQVREAPTWMRRTPEEIEADTAVT